MVNKLTLPSKENDVQLKVNEIIDEYVDKASAQDISGRKTFLGEKAIYFKQIASSNKLGFTLYNTSSTEIGAFEYRPNTIGGGALLNVNCSYSSTAYVGFRYWGTAVNIIAPKVATAGNYYIPVNITDGNTTVKATSAGTVNISSLLPTVNDATLTIQKNGVDVQTFTANSATNATANITVPTDTADLTNGAGFITSSALPTVNNPTITLTQGGVSKGSFTLNQATGATIALTDTTYSAFTGADGVNAGSSGLVPAPAATDNTKYLKGDGTWDTVTASASWGSITGTLSNQTDLDNALNAKADTDLSNLTATGKSTGAELSLPSENYVDLTLGASGATYTAPANGWVCVHVVGQLAMSIIDSNNNNLLVTWTSAGSACYLPVRKNMSYTVTYAAVSQVVMFKFVYAEGEI